jgi:hypothetical protein
MKSLNTFRSSLIIVAFLTLLSISQTSCWELMEGEGIGGLSEVTILSEDEAILSEADLKINGEGRLVATKELSLNKLLGEIELRRVPGESNPQLFIKGKENAFGEVLSKENKVRIFEYNKAFEISKTIYSVESNEVVVRANSEISPNNIVGRVKKGNLVVKLSEENGWYQVKVVKNTRITYGWIEAKYLAPAITGVSNENNCERDLTGNYTFNNKSNYRCSVTLYTKDVPTSWIGNPGLQNAGQLIINSQESQTFFNIKSGYYNCVIAFGDGRNILDSRNYKMTQISVETCQTSTYNAKY